jgi:hypothetical protein
LKCPDQANYYSSFVINYLQSVVDEGVAITYIYCNYKEPDHTLANLLGSLLQQVVRHQSKLPPDILDLFKRHEQQRTRPSRSELSTLLHSQITSVSKVFIIVDALDESSDAIRDSFLAELRKLASYIHLLVTSRPHLVNLVNEFDKHTSLEIRANDSDVIRYLASEIEASKRLRAHTNSDPTLKDDIMNTIVSKVQGMYLPVFEDD